MSRKLNSYTGMSQFAKVALNCVASQLDAEQLDSIDQAFTAMDINHDGELSLDELTQGLKQLGIDPKNAAQLADALDINHDGSIQYTEFVASLLSSQHDLAESNLRHAFDIFDVDHNGSISLDELRLMLSGSGPLASVLEDGKTPDSVLKEIDTSNDGVISFAEFRAYLVKETTKSGLPDAVAPVLPRESVESVLQRLAVEAGQSEADGISIARRLAAEHWIVTIGDLPPTSSSHWLRLQLPMKLEKLLKASCSTV